jgi:hypothetical protein
VTVAIVGSAEKIEYVRNQFWLDSATTISHLENRRVVLPTQSYPNTTALWGVLSGITKQIEKNLLKTGIFVTNRIAELIGD